MPISSITYDRPQAPDRLPPPEKSADPTISANNRAISSAVKLLNSSGSLANGHEFSVAIDRTTKQAVVRIVNSSTNELVEQLPSEYILRVAQQIGEVLAQQSHSQVDKSL